MQTKKKYKKGISIDLTKFQWLVVTVMFVMIVIVPIIGNSLYVSIKNRPKVEETYTKEALIESEKQEENQGRVAGVYTFKDDKSGETYYHIPIINYDFSFDFSNPSNVLTLVGGILLLASIIIFLGIVLDLFKQP